MEKANLVVQINSSAMLSGMCIPLQPRNVLEFGGINQALIYQQIEHLSGPVICGSECIQAARISYTRLARMIPSMSRRWTIAVVGKMVDQGALKITKTKRVNLLSVNAHYEFKTQETPGSSTPLLVFPELLKKLHVVDSILLQQIHIRCKGMDGSVWVIRSRRQLHSEILNFVSLATVNRAATRLEERGLLLVKPYEGSDCVVNSYRVNYIKLAELLSLPMPIDVKADKYGSQEKWTSPLYPALPTQAVGSAQS